MIRPPLLPDVNVILADPDEFARRSAREVLRAARLNRVHEVRDSFALLDRLGNLAPGLLLLDVALPGLHRRSVARQLSASRFGVVAMARFPTLGLVEWSRRWAEGGVMAKPLVPSRVWLRLATVCRGMQETGRVVAIGGAGEGLSDAAWARPDRPDAMLGGTPSN